MLGPPAEFLALEEVAGLGAGPASDFWVLDCSIIQSRSGEGSFSGYEVGSPADLIRVVLNSLGEIQIPWFHYDGQPTKDDQPEHDIVKTNVERS